MEEHKVILIHKTNDKSFDLIERSIGGCTGCVFTSSYNCPRENDEYNSLLCGSTSHSIFVESNSTLSKDSKPEVKATNDFTAPLMLKRASDLMVERAVQYDSPSGERSMEKIITAFNAITGKDLTESQGWMLMVLLKLVRDNTRVLGHQDSCEDLIAYGALYGESRLSNLTKGE